MIIDRRLIMSLAVIALRMAAVGRTAGASVEDRHSTSLQWVETFMEAIWMAVVVIRPTSEPDTLIAMQMVGVNMAVEEGQAEALVTLAVVVPQHTADMASITLALGMGNTNKIIHWQPGLICTKIDLNSHELRSSCVTYCED